MEMGENQEDEIRTTFLLSDMCIHALNDMADCSADQVVKGVSKMSVGEKLMSNYKESPSYLPFSDYFMSLCLLSGARSKDPVTKVGACIVSKNNRVLSVGYNGMPSGVNDNDLPWNKHGEHIYDTKYPYVCHAEMNAIMNVKLQLHDLAECCIYVSKFPCPECAKLIIQSGIRSVVYAEYKPEPFEVEFTTKRMFELAGISCKKYTPSVQKVTINIVGEKGEVSIDKIKN